MANLHNDSDPASGTYGVVPPTGVYQEKWPSNAVFTQGFAGGLSVAGWTSGNEGFVQQSFLGASIRSLSVNAGFGDSSSTMGIELVNDEFNKSDNTGFGGGDDVYHNGLHDKFSPPVVGAPVFFKFGKNFADVEQAFRKDFDQIYGTDTLDIPDDPFPIFLDKFPIKTHPSGSYLLDSDPASGTSRWIDKSVLLDPDTKWRGFDHFTFGGILQSYTENRSSAGNPLYNVKLTDPREILTNTELVLNNYQGTTFNNKNLYNIYGFLEYDPSTHLSDQLSELSTDKRILTKEVDSVGKVTYTGDDLFIFKEEGGEDIEVVVESLEEEATIKGSFPITGQGFARRGDNGIPWYRVEQAMNSLFSYKSDLPKEYKDAGFGGVVDFRGYNYVVDWGGIPTEQIPQTYYLDFDNLNMLDLAQELCEILSRELYVSLLPVVDHPSCSKIFQENKEVIALADQLPQNSPERNLILGSGLINGIIRIDSIDKKEQPKYGTVKQYLEDLEALDIFVENRDVGFEVSNVVTDKFIVGAQEVDMHYFNGLRDRDNYLERLQDTGDAQAQQRLEQLSHDKWTLDTNLKQQIIPFYGFIGDKAVTIPRGFGSYQQILLDARGLDAHGVGAYYVATEMELRAASVSYKAWQNFLLTYNELYIQELSSNQAFYAHLGMNMTEEVAGINDQLDEDSPIKQQLDDLAEAGRKFGVSVPRSVWNSDKSDRRFSEIQVDPETGEAETDEDGNEVFDETTGGPFEGKMGKDGYPANPCNPPFGYPLYYKRAEKIGIPQAGYTQAVGSIHTLMTSVGTLEDLRRSDKERFSYVKTMASKSTNRLRALIAQKENTKEKSSGGAYEELQKDINILKDRIDKINDNIVKEAEEIKNLRDERKISIMHLKETIKNSAGIIKNMAQRSRDSLKNAKKVHAFIKKIADDNLGKKFLVKIPRATNVNWSAEIKTSDQQGGGKRVLEPINSEIVAGRPWDVVRGPFGFAPQPISSEPDYKGGEEWKASLKEFKKVAEGAERSRPSEILLDGATWPTRSHTHWHYLDTDAMGESSADFDNKDIPAYGSGYTNGALKCNFNPMSEKWEHNYKPEPQGGFFNYALFDKNLKVEEQEVNNISKTKLPKVTRNVLAPKLMDKIVSDSNRIQCYVRYDHSQHLDFQGVSPADVEQQLIGDDGTIIPDVMETLPNLKPDQKNVLNQIQARVNDDKDFDRQGESVAFVKCELDERFYMAPKTIGGDAVIWAEDFSVNLAPTPYEVIYVDAETLTEDELAEYGEGPWEGCKVPREVKRRPIPSFGVPKGGGLLNAGGKSENDSPQEEGDEENAKESEPVDTASANRARWDDFEREYSETYNGWIIKTKEKDLDPKHVYALITVPGRIVPTVDKRYVDGPLRAINGPLIANELTEDVVKILEFTKPGLSEPPTEVVVDCDSLPEGVDFTFEDISRAVEAQKKVVQGISLSNNGDNSKLAFTSPSPIYPDMVALPLMSMERCYGPWVSSALDGETLELGDVRFSEIGGKIEFVKEEGLAPWSYAGYQLMDQAAKMKTKFSNSLLLFSERGSFSYADAPIGVSLAKALQDRGPLVTSISVTVGQAIKTSVKLDLYTSQFGKLQKQKEIAIAQISRERQKIIDQNNALIRRGLGKNAANMDLLKTLGAGNIQEAAKISDQIIDVGKGIAKPSLITISATNSEQGYMTYNVNERGDGTTQTVSIPVEDSEGVMQSESELREMKSLNNDAKMLNKKMEQTAGGNVTDLFSGTSDAPDNPNFASRKINRQQQTNYRTWG